MDPLSDRAGEMSGGETSWEDVQGGNVRLPVTTSFALHKLWRFIQSVKNKKKRATVGFCLFKNVSNHVGVY